MTAPTEPFATELSAQRNGKAPKILCIDDDPEVSRAIELRLSKYHAQVFRAFHGMHGYWLAVKEQPDVIITDLKMPQGAGDYVLESLKQNPQTTGIPVVVLTGYRDAELAGRMTDLGAAALLTKPIHFDDLAEELARHVNLFTKDWTTQEALLEPTGNGRSIQARCRRACRQPEID